MKDCVLDLYDRAYFGEVDRSNIICSSFTKDYTIILKISIYRLHRPTSQFIAL